ncbi:STAS domain-containing protein [Simplicispira psychrophila]|uniref:STAS domain-containing protein n=1 Tax=Simplicispira psychrophila TaxID=80882 RepID=UPI0006901567|nr:STAS domain-containing protein [Simplicispira psychrophila]
MTTGQTLRIEGEFNIYRAMELKAVLFAEPPATEIDLSGVTELDSSGLQLLMLAKKTALAQNRPLSLVAHSQVVIDVFELLDVAGYFGDPLVMRSRAPIGTESGPDTATPRNSDGS